MCQQEHPTAPIPTPAAALDAELDRLRAYIRVLENQTEQHQLLTEIMVKLTATMDTDTRFSQLAHLLVPSLSDLCVIYTISDDQLVQALTFAHAEPEREARAVEELHHYPIEITSAHPVAEAIRSDSTIRYMNVGDAVLDTIADSPAQHTLLRHMAPCSLMSIPLRARGRIIGVLHLAMDSSQRHFSIADQKLAEEIALRAALVIDNARLYEQEQRNRQSLEETLSRLARLQRTTAALSASHDLEDVLRVIVTQALQVLGASAGSVMILDATGAGVTQLGQFGYDADLVQEWQQFSIERKLPATDTLRTGVAHWLPSRAAARDYPLLLEADPQSAAWASLPLKHGDQIIGALGLGFAAPQAFTMADREFMQSLASQCALALDRAQHYELEQQLRALAERAMRERDQVVSLISHDLKSPLAAIQGYTQLLQRRVQQAELPDAERWLRALHSVALSSTRVSLLIEELLDVASLQAGQELTLYFEQTDLVPLVQRAVEAGSVLSSIHSIELAVQHAQPLLCELDSMRVERVLNNLIANAIKYSPQGGVVRVAVACSDDTPAQAIVQVQDHGIGIPEEELPTIFEPFQRASNVPDTIRGTGLGLASSRQIIEQHGGAIRATSVLGAGTTFIINLPLSSEQDGQDGV